MKKDELKSTLGSIKASDGLVERTMLVVANRRRAEKREPFFLRMGFGVRLAGAACALLLTVTVAGALMKSGSIPSANSTEDVQKAKDSVIQTEAQTPCGTTSTRDTIDLLKQDAQDCDGEWAIFKGSVFYAAPSKASEEGTYPIDVSISVINHEESSEGIEGLTENIEAYALFTDDAERHKLIDSINEPISLLIEKDSMGKWKIKRIIY